ncbi:MAG: protein-L-isoaspartate O-methyltransferase [Robiginitomaculum sp.]|nr:MAG: protein-L-isoaspartate O-methyltransferase [Robiginitomaculum sp.]
MFDFNAARVTMLDSQIRTNDVTDFAIQAAFRKIPRELFVPKSKMALAYGDANVDVGEGRWLIRPRDFSKMIDAADIAKTDVVLDIACGRGYSVAVMAELAETVVALEETDEAVERATSILERCGVTNAAVVKGELKAGAPEHGPFDVIFVNAAVSTVPQTWLDQLANGGRLLVAKAEGPLCRVMVFTKTGDKVGERIVFDAQIPTLPGFTPEQEFVL